MFLCALLSTFVISRLILASTLEFWSWFSFIAVLAWSIGCCLALISTCFHFVTHFHILLLRVQIHVQQLLVGFPRPPNNIIVVLCSSVYSSVTLGRAVCVCATCILCISPLPWCYFSCLIAVIVVYWCCSWGCSCIVGNGFCNLDAFCFFHIGVSVYPCGESLSSLWPPSWFSI